MPNTRDIWPSSPTGWLNWPLLTTVLNHLTIDKGTSKRHRERVDEERKKARLESRGLRRLATTN